MRRPRPMPQSLSPPSMVPPQNFSQNFSPKPVNGNHGNQNGNQSGEMETMVEQHKAILQQYNDLLQSYQLQCLIAQASVRYLAENNYRNMLGLPTSVPTQMTTWGVPQLGATSLGGFPEYAIVPNAENSLKRSLDSSDASHAQPLDLSKPKKAKLVWIYIFFLLIWFSSCHQFLLSVCKTVRSRCLFCL